jgi:metal-responsive CopG/Arc/MetJ family transcriptional regulator
MINNSTNINKTTNNLIVDHHCLEVIVDFVDIGGIVDHHCLEVIVGFVGIGGIVDHHC